MNKFVVSETGSSTWHYHLRLLGPGGVKLGGLPSTCKALCGHDLGWDTMIPFDRYNPNRKPEQISDGTYCSKCYEIAKKLIEED